MLADNRVLRRAHGELRVEAFEVNHWGRRWPSDKPRGYNGYVLRREGRALLFGGDTAMTPLFRIVEADRRSERDYAATVTFAGRRYSAGAPANVFCYRPGDTAACSAVRGDRSGSVHRA